MKHRLWIYVGWFAGIGIAYAVGKSAAPDAALPVVICAIFGGGMLGALIDKIASND